MDTQTNKTHVPFGKALRAARRAKNLRAEQLAVEIGVGYNALANWERGKHQPKVGELERLADVLGWDLPWDSIDPSGSDVVPISEATERYEKRKGGKTHALRRVS